MKKFIILFSIILLGCNHPSTQKHKHLIYDNNENAYYITSELKFHDGCASFTCIDPYDFEGEVTKTICGSFRIEY